MKKSEIYLNKCKEVAELLKAKQYPSEQDLTVDILTSGIYPKAIIILSFFNALKAKKMGFNKYELARRLNMSDYSIQRYSRFLVECGLLKRDLEHSKEGTRAFYSIFDFCVLNAKKTDVIEIGTVGTIENPTEPIVCDLEKNETKKKGTPLCERAETPAIKSVKASKNEVLSEIILYLNERANKNYRDNNKQTLKSLNARIREGYSLDDFKSVIDYKVEQWGSDDKMKEYLRPQTLFAVSHFEDYLSQARGTIEKQKQDIVGGSYSDFKSDKFIINEYTDDGLLRLRYIWQDFRGRYFNFYIDKVSTRVRLVDIIECNGVFAMSYKKKDGTLIEHSYDLYELRDFDRYLDFTNFLKKNLTD